MAKMIELVRILHSSTACQREMSPAVLSDAIELWRQKTSLVAYQVILSALDSNDEEIRSTVERFLKRSSPRPRNYRKEAPCLNCVRTLQRRIGW
jgi:predicted nucleic-acid-binding protein